jgi:5-methylcytosine-specific restriction enzyme subunit McrC
MPVITKYEHEYLNKKELDNNEFEKIKKFILRTNERYEENGREKPFEVVLNDGSEAIKFKQYVGLFEYDDNKYLEILPKTYKNHTEASGRNLLIKMLLDLYDLQYKELEKTILNYTNKFTLLDVFIKLFTIKIQNIIKQGINRKYVKIKENNKYLKGRLVLPIHLSKNMFHKEKFFIEYFSYSADIPENRLLKTALNYLKNKAISFELKKEINQLLFVFADIPISENIHKENIFIDRTFKHYVYAITLAKIFLNKKSFSPVLDQFSDEKEKAVSLLFDMNKLFEEYVANRIRKKYTSVDLTTQEQKYYIGNIISDNNKEKNIFKIKPDMVIRLDNLLYILDTKWKIINESDIQNNFNISQGDIYQVFTYGNIYRLKENKGIKLFLIYPKNENFEKPIKIYIQEDVYLEVVPYDIEKESYFFERLGIDQ